jgi:hypothetical protein
MRPEYCAEIACGRDRRRLAGRVVVLADRLVVLEGVHLGEVVVADDLGKPRDKGLPVLAGLHILRGQVHRLLDLRHRPHHAEIGDLRPIGRRLGIDAVPDRVEQL